MQAQRTTWIFVMIFVLGAGAGLVLGQFGSSMPDAAAGGGEVSSPVGAAPDRYAYYPGTEELKPDEIRLTACGTGMPAARRGQAAACFLIELGNGDKFLFDVGTGSMANVMSLMIPANFLTKVFISHLHTDHFGDLASLWAGGWTGGRTRPLEIWGPSGAREDMGTKYAIDHFLKCYNWDYMTRAAKINPIPGGITCHEFDYKGENQVIYKEKGVTIRSWPAIHTGDGPVSFSLEWNGLKLVYGGDTVPNKWFNKYAQDADIIIHECMHTVEQLVGFYNQAPQLALRMNTNFHTSAQAFGKIMSMMKPRHAIAYHFFNEEGTRFGVYEGIRETYSGPVSLATDMMVWNISKDAIKERMAVSPDDAWDVPGSEEALSPDPTRKSELTPAMDAGRFDVSGVDAPMVKRVKAKYGLK